MFPFEFAMNNHYDAQSFAEQFSSWYYANHDRNFPLNPFQVLSDLEIHFVFRNFDKIEGLLMPSTQTNDINLVVLNAKRPIQRQRFSAAHELCHMLKDVKDGISGSFICETNSKNYIERYADRFASAFLMPRDEMIRQIELRGRGDEPLSLDDILIIAEYFGTSFSACYFRIKDICGWYAVPDEKARKKYRPRQQRDKLGFSDLMLLCDMLDSWQDIGYRFSSEYAQHIYRSQYLYNDARIEGVDVSFETVAEIVEDLYHNTQHSIYCDEQHKAYCHIAGHMAMYQHLYETDLHKEKISVFDTTTLHRKLFSRFPHPEFGGRLRTANPVVLGAKFETLDYRQVIPAMLKLDSKLQLLDKNSTIMAKSDIVKQIAEIHHRMTVIHPFPDGNGRTSRGFMNMLLLRYGLPPIYVRTKDKDLYRYALSTADAKADYTKLYSFIMFELIRSHVELSMLN